jgi:2,3-bisphosphoglycerate-independent phosphoglycerate mutase
MKSLKGLSQKVLLVILDGFGINPKSKKNAIIEANTPNLNDLFGHYPFTVIEASGEAVGLPKGIMGNSEVGHLNLGSGREIRQDLVRINESIQKGEFKSLPKMKELIEKAKSKNKRVHLLGLLSDGGVHSHISHLEEIIKILSDEKLEVFLHAFMDGRDTPPKSGDTFVERIHKTPNFHFASMQGRSFGMDRDRRWDRIEKGYNAIIGKGNITSKKPLEYVFNEYEKGITDEFITPILFDKEFAIKKDDSVFFFNFRPDRAVQITLTLTLPSFDHFKREITPSYFLCMTPYVVDEIKLPILFDKEKVDGGLSELLSKKGLKQFKIAETEKFAHITYFFNGGHKEPFPNEERVLIPSPREVATYDEKPEMSALEVLDKLVSTIKENKHQFYLVNFANSDMVGHTGNFKAAISAIETIDHCIGSLMKACSENNITMLLTADHGNSDQMEYEDGTPHTAHTTALVPFSVFHASLKKVTLEKEKSDHALRDVAPTVLEIMNIPLPSNFTGRPIFR